MSNHFLPYRDGKYLINVHEIGLVIFLMLSVTQWILVFYRRRKRNWMRLQPRGRRGESLRMRLQERRKPSFIVI